MEPSTADQLYSSPKSGGSGKKILFIILAIIILAALGFGGYQLFTASNSFEEEEDEEFILTPTEEPTQTPTPIATTSATPTSKVTPKVSPTKTSTSTTPTTTPKPTQNPLDKTSGLDRSKLTIEILNGSGTAGVAKKAADLLTELGYSISSTGNADTYDYANTVIEIKSSKSDYLSLLKKDLSGSYTVGSSSASLSTSSTADARVIVGKQ